MKMQKFNLKKDKFREQRGGYARFLNIFCDHCRAHLALYQKDGPGELKRMYLDRILAPKIKRKKRDFSCSSCHRVVGTFYIYQKEKRSAIRLYQGAVFKKTGRGVYTYIK